MNSDDIVAVSGILTAVITVLIAPRAADRRASKRAKQEAERLDVNERLNTLLKAQADDRINLSQQNAELRSEVQALHDELDQVRAVLLSFTTGRINPSGYVLIPEYVWAQAKRFVPPELAGPFVGERRRSTDPLPDPLMPAPPYSSPEESHDDPNSP